MLIGRLGVRFRLRLRLRFRLRRTRPLLLPLIELLCLLLFLFRTALLDRRRWPHQRMRFLRRRTRLLRRRTESVWTWPRFVPIEVFRLSVMFFRFRIALCFKRSRLRVRLYLDLRVSVRGLANGTEALLIRLRFSRSRWRGLGWSGGTKQRLLIQVSAGLRLPLLD